MKVYTVAELTITDPSWTEQYLKQVTPMVERHGGRYLARTPNMEKIEGQRALPQLALIIEFPSRQAADAFYYSEEYAPFLAQRKAGANNEFMIVNGEDHSGVATM